MACTSLTGGITKGCENNIGGIKKLYFTEFENVASVGYGSPETDIRDIQMSNSAVFYEFEFNKNTSTFSEASALSQETGTKVVTQTITLVLNYREQTKRDQLILLGGFKDLACIVLDSNGKYWYPGLENGVNLTESNSESGTAKTDRNGYTLTFIGEEPEEAPEVLESAVAAVLA